MGLLSRFPITQVRSHIDELNDQRGRIFSRDCLEAEIVLPEGLTLTLFINHLKSKLVQRKKNESDAEYLGKVLQSHKKRLAQAQKVAEYVNARFSGHHDQSLYAVVGDFNDTPESPWVAPVIKLPHLTDLLAAHRPHNDRWTYYRRGNGHVSQIDYVLASRALARRVADVVASDPLRKPHIERQGLAYKQLNNAGQILPKATTLVHFEEDEVTPAPAEASPDEKTSFQFPRYPEVMANWKTNISDHCPVKVWF